jgi:transposase
MHNYLSSKERKELILMHRQDRDKRVCDRIKAVLLHVDGYSYAEIAKILLRDDATVRRYVNEYFSDKKLTAANGGSESHLSVAETNELLTHLRETTYLHVKSICAYVEKKFKKQYSISGMTKWLKLNGFRYKKPHGIPAKADQQQQEIFINQYNELKNNLPENEVIYFADSSHPQHQTRLAYGWIEKGTRKCEKMTACQKRVNVIGAINLTDYHIEYMKVDWVNKESLREFFTQLIDANPEARKIHLMLDNAGYHKSKELTAFFSQTKIVVHFLPPYSPNLNPIERLWKIMHEMVTYNRYYPKFIDFTEAILNFFKNIINYADKIKSRINDNFQHVKCA